MLIMDTGGTVLAEVSAAHFSQAIQTAGQGAGNVDGRLGAADSPGIGVEPQLDLPSDPVAVYGPE